MAEHSVEAELSVAAERSVAVRRNSSGRTIETAAAAAAAER